MSARNRSSKYDPQIKRDPVMPPWMVKIATYIDRKYAAWCRRRGKDYWDIFDDGTGPIREARFRARSERSSRMQAQRNAAVGGAGARVEAEMMTHTDSDRT